ncbi:division plane positioning ATPase MipZ [Acinetobacter tibetensis]|uniref:division plane positioning ATPase MipZ n=1 Tax=Acinetobacter tibetensis TaxID=2943497 RepID=UPI003A4DC244
MLILIANSKGGSHKTSLATSILAELSKNHAVTGIDLDAVNRSALKWSEGREETQGKFYELTGDIKDELARVRDDYDHVIVDAGGFDNVEIRTAMALADVVLIPLKVGSLDNIEGFRNIVDLAYEFQPVKENPAKVYGVVVGVKGIGGGAEIRRALTEIADYDIVKPLKTSIADRIWYGRAVDAKVGLTEYQSPDPKDRRYVELAQKEFLAMLEEIM